VVVVAVVVAHIFYEATFLALFLLVFAEADARLTAVLVDESKSRVGSFYPTETKRGRRPLNVICVLLHLQRAGLIDPVDAALDEPLVPRCFPQSTLHQHSQEPCEWQTRWQMSSPSSRRPIPLDGLSLG
jgi:hypothetical protein